MTVTPAAADPSTRFAIYFAPPPESALAAFGNGWFGRDIRTGAARPRPSVSGFSDDAIADITREPSAYGFHATLKPPFHLAGGTGEAAVLDACRAFAATRRPFRLPPLVLGELDGFLALLTAAPSVALDALAADCVRAFDPLRAPTAAGELARRRAAGLTGREAELLERWGYPYVFDAWRFHMTLTGRLDAAMRHALLRALPPLLEALLATPVCVDAICLFVQPSHGEPMHVRARFPFAGPPAAE